MIPGKIVRGVTTAEKNARRKKLFKKIKRNVNAVGGNNRRKKAIYKKFTDHKNRTKEKVSITWNCEKVFFYKKPKVEPFIFSVYMKVNSELWFLTARRN